MLCKIVKQDESFFEPDEQGFRKMPVFGRGKETWYRLLDNGKSWQDDGKLSRYSIKKSWIDEGERYYSGAPLQDKEAIHLIKGYQLVVDEDWIQLDKRFNI